MKCPYCSEDMRVGYIQSARPIFWGEEKHKLLFSPRGNEEFTISESFWDCTAEAFYCAQCGKVVIEV